MTSIVQQLQVPSDLFQQRSQFRLRLLESAKLFFLSFHSSLPCLQFLQHILLDQHLATSFRLMLIPFATSVSVLGVSVSLHAAYSAAATSPGIDLPLTRPLSSAFL